MAMVEHLVNDQGDQLRLTPNRSLSWRGNIHVWLGLLIIMAGINTGMWLAGAWVILPFAGLELAALALGFYLTARQCRRQELLLIAPELLRLEKGIFHKETEWTLPRRATRIHLVAARHPWTPPRLFLLHQELEIALAPFLNMDDTRLLVDILEGQGLCVERRQPDQGVWF